MKKSFIYTGGGDKGTTSLVGGQRVSKGHLRLEAYGTVDELNSYLGLFITEIEEQKVIDTLQFIQHKLFTVGSYLATDTATTQLNAASQIKTEDIQKIEQAIDEIDNKLPKMKGFILPGGCKSASLAHICRTICRRAERYICRLAEVENVNDEVLTFVNRLSDYLFIIARYECLLKNKEEIIWDNTCF